MTRIEGVVSRQVRDALTRRYAAAVSAFAFCGTSPLAPERAPRRVHRRYILDVAIRVHYTTKGD
jgi:hypothetical protein